MFESSVAIKTPISAVGEDLLTFGSITCHFLSNRIHLFLLFGQSIDSVIS